MAVFPVAQEAVVPVQSDNEDWRIVHVLAESCACSRDVLDYLLERGSEDGFQEDVVLLDGSGDFVSKLRAQGFSVTTAESESLCEAFGSEGVPFFQVLEADDSLRYSGAYYDSVHRTYGGFQDLDTYSKIKNGKFVRSRPVYGCATSDRLKSRLDPFGLKY